MTPVQGKRGGTVGRKSLQYSSESLVLIIGGLQNKDCPTQGECGLGMSAVADLKVEQLKAVNLLCFS